MASHGAVAGTQRIESIDAIRGIALFGVLIVNLVTEFRVSLFQQFIGPSPALLASDPAIERWVLSAIGSKAFCLFALLFGVGLAMQFERLSEGRRPLYWLARRLGVLLVLGLVHLVFIWNGDILVEYAVAGFMVLPLLLLPSGAIVAAAAVFLVIYAVGPSLYAIPWPSAAELRAHVALASDVYAHRGFMEIWRFSLSELRLILPLHLFVLPRTLALFAFGMFLWRAGFLRDAVSSWTRPRSRHLSGPSAERY